MDLEKLKSLSPEALKRLLPGFLSGFISRDSQQSLLLLEGLVNSWSQQGTIDVHSALAQPVTTGTVQWGLKECREISRTWSHSVIKQNSIHGLEHLEKAIDSGPTIILSNHLSYFDATATDALIAWQAPELANRIVFAAGPKVYQSLFRRVAAAGLNTMLVPQSNRLAHTETVPPRELARLIHASLAASKTLLEKGHPILLYPEGSRSRSGRLNPFIPGVHRYLNQDQLQILPLAITGTQAVMPVGAKSVTPNPVALRFERPITLQEVGSPRDLLAETYRKIGEMLPPSHAPPPYQSVFV
jgi:1-acyl-sn-glycerol-3-phosphate acyltransferase